MNDVFSFIKEYFDVPGMIIVLSSGFFVKYYLSSWKLNTAWKTFLLSFLFFSIYVFILTLQDKNTVKLLMNKLFFTYVVTTSLYELFVKILIDKINNILKINLKNDQI